MIRSKKLRPLAEINVVPYIDVMLVLLVIFMITAPLLSQGVEVNLPSAEAKSLAATQKEPIIVSVDTRGNYYLNIATKPDKVITSHALSEKVSVELSKDKREGRKRVVLVKGDKDVDYGRVIQAMILLQQAGAGNIGLITQPLSENR